MLLMADEAPEFTSKAIGIIMCLWRKERYFGFETCTIQKQIGFVIEKTRSTYKNIE